MSKYREDLIGRILKVRTKILKFLSWGGAQSLAFLTNGIYTKYTWEFEDNLSSSIFQRNVVFVITFTQWSNCKSVHLQADMHEHPPLFTFYRYVSSYKMIKWCRCAPSELNLWENLLVAFCFCLSFLFQSEALVKRREE